MCSKICENGSTESTLWPWCTRPIHTRAPTGSRTRDCRAKALRPWDLPWYRTYRSAPQGRRDEASLRTRLDAPDVALESQHHGARIAGASAHSFLRTRSCAAASARRETTASACVPNRQTSSLDSECSKMYSRMIERLRWKNRHDDATSKERREITDYPIDAVCARSRRHGHRARDRRREWRTLNFVRARAIRVDEVGVHAPFTRSSSAASRGSAKRAANEMRKRLL